MSRWRFAAYRLNGDGTQTKLHPDIPLTNTVVDVELSGPGGISGTLEPETRGLIAPDGGPLLVPWSTAIYAVRNGHIRQGAIITNLPEDGPKLGVESVGFTGYANGQPYTADNSWIGVDPLNVVRHIWTHLQTKSSGNLGLVVDGTTSPVRVGKQPPEGVTVSKEEGPYILGWWESHDLGKEIDDLATATPFDYLALHEFDDGNGGGIAHRLQLGYPTIGRRRPDLRFVYGENIFDQPTIDYDGEDYADEVLLLGAGEGRKMIRGLQQRMGTGRLRRSIVIEDKTKTSETDANRAAQDELSYRLGSADISSLVVTDHPNAPQGSYTVGDEIEVRTKKGWHHGLKLWVRILAVSTDTKTNRDTLTVARSEKGNR